MITIVLLHNLSNNFVHFLTKGLDLHVLLLDDDIEVLVVILNSLKNTSNSDILFLRTSIS